MLLREYAIEWWSAIPPLLTNVSALPGERWTPKLSFQLCCMLVSQAAAMKNPRLPMTEPWRGECRPPLSKSTCWACWGRPKGDSRLLFWFLAIQLACVCQASYRRHLKCFLRPSLLHGVRSWKQQCPFKDKPHDDDDDDDDAQSCRAHPK